MLGSGTSTGVPRVGDDWGDCDPSEPRNRRLRVSIMVESSEGKRLLVDTSTDLRQQLLTNGISQIDGVFWTHDHAEPPSDEEIQANLQVKNLFLQVIQ